MSRTLQEPTYRLKPRDPPHRFADAGAAGPTSLAAGAHGPEYANASKDAGAPRDAQSDNSGRHCRHTAIVGHERLPYHSTVTVLDVIQRSTDFLSRKGVENPRLQVELILAHVLRMPRLNLYLQFERKLTEPELEQVRTMLRRRGAREPLQHILGSTSFCGIELKVTPDVLTPRPETELLAESAWKLLNALPRQREPRQVLDYGTGSGCLAIAVAVHAPAAHVMALDLSERALAVARENTQAHRLSERIDFIQGGELDALPPELKFDLILSNPPYIPTAEIATLMPEVRDHDPRAALDGGADGLVFYRYFASEAASWLLPGGRLMAEFGDGQADAIREIFTAESWFIESIERDLSGGARFFIARPSGMRKE